MSQQTTLNNDFKSKASPGESDTGIATKRRNVDLRKSPHASKIPRNNKKNVTIEVNEQEVEIIVSSDSENDLCTPKKSFPPQKPNSDETESSTETVSIVCDVSPSMFTQETEDSPPRNGQVSQQTDRIFVRKDLTQEFNSSGTSSPNVDTSSVSKDAPRTPSKTPRSNKSSGKYFSPSKKRVLSKISPAKRNLTQEFNGNNGWSSPGEKDRFSNVCEGHDYKTKFLLTMIDKYLSDDGLRCLLDDSSQSLLMAGMATAKPAMKLVCRLYWRQPVWFKRNKLLEICTTEYKQKKDKQDKTNKRIIDGPEMEEVINSLVTNGWIDCSAVEGENMCTVGFDDFAKILNRSELLNICKDLKLKILSKQDAVNALKVFSQQSSIAKFFVTKSNLTNNRTRVLKMMRQKAGNCYKLSDLAERTLNKLYMLMFLGADYSLIREKRLELMLIHDKTNVETYPVDKNMAIDNASIVFQSKEQFDRYFNAHNMYEDFLKAVDASKRLDIIKDAYKQYKNMDEEELLRCLSLPTWLRTYTPSYVYVRILDSGVQELKKDRTEACYRLAVDILESLMAQLAFRQYKVPEWRAEMALVLCKYLDRCEEAAEVLIEGFQAEVSDEAKDCMRRRATKMAKQQNIKLSDELRAALLTHGTKESLLEKNQVGIHIYKHPVDNYNQKGKQRFEAFTEGGRLVLSAEEYCKMHLVNEGRYTHGEHWEGRIITTMYSLLFWDVIYGKPEGVPGVFLSYYQRYPLDMYSESFYENRKTLIDDRLIFIEESTDDMVVEIMQSRWEERPEHDLAIQRGIGWDNIQMVATCLGARGVTAVCRRLATSCGRAHCGFPDLTMWNIHTNKITFIEVKTDADEPSIKQLQWMDYLSSHGIDTKFCYVGANTTRKRARPSNLSLSPD